MLTTYICHYRSLGPCRQGRVSWIAISSVGLLETLFRCVPSRAFQSSQAELEAPHCLQEMALLPRPSAARHRALSDSSSFNGERGAVAAQAASTVGWRGGFHNGHCLSRSQRLGVQHQAVAGSAPRDRSLPGLHPSRWISATISLSPLVCDVPWGREQEKQEKMSLVSLLIGH